MIPIIHISIYDANVLTTFNYTRIADYFNPNINLNNKALS